MPGRSALGQTLSAAELGQLLPEISEIARIAKDNVELHQKNIEALKRELSNIR